MIKNNDIRGNFLAGIWIKTGSAPTVESNVIYDGLEGGICVSQGGCGMIEKNEIRSNQFNGILVTGQSSPHIHENVIHNNKGSGILLTGDATAAVTGNSVFENLYNGIAVASGVRSRVCDNAIFNNHCLVEKAIVESICTFRVSGDIRYPMQDFYRCVTCGTKDGDAICVSCAYRCHADHEIEWVRRDRCYCDCGAGTLQTNSGGGVDTTTMTCCPPRTESSTGCCVPSATCTSTSRDGRCDAAGKMPAPLEGPSGSGSCMACNVKDGSVSDGNLKLEDVEPLINVHMQRYARGLHNSKIAATYS